MGGLEGWSVYGEADPPVRSKRTAPLRRGAVWEGEASLRGGGLPPPPCVQTFAKSASAGRFRIRHSCLRRNDGGWSWGCRKRGQSLAEGGQLAFGGLGSTEPGFGEAGDVGLRLGGVGPRLGVELSAGELFDCAEDLGWRGALGGFDSRCDVGL